ncbi:MAG: NUDIX domain-containing protein [Liquorilactobacillus hordei]|uniref:NUDIX domain-containing protein n=1 Tax=Liquorilactobacillus hordei TaxID=468911 RepID=UPI0039ECAC37
MNEKKYSDNFNEIWDIYNINLQKIGIKRRRDTLIKGEFHLVVGVFVLDNNRVLLQKRTLSKLNNPGKWQETAGGSVLSGESIYMAASREVYEELGINLRIEADNFFFKEIQESWITFWFVVTTQLDINKLIIQKAEVDKVEFFEITKAIELLKNKGIDNTWERLKLISQMDN